MNHVRPLMLVVLAAAVALLGGCAGKAEALRVTASAFEAEAVEAIDAIDDMRRRELAPATRSPIETAGRFVDNALASTRPATPARIAFWADPDTPSLDPEVERAWVRFLGDLRRQYAELGRAFAPIEAASFTARGVVARAEPPVSRMTAQLVLMAERMAAQPPRLLNRRGALLDELETVRQATDTTPARKRAALLAWYGEWQRLRDEETALAERIVGQCLEAATVGRELRRQLLAYDRLTLADLHEGTQKVLVAAGPLLGRDLSSLQAGVARVRADIEADPVWSMLVESLLDDLDAARSTE